MQVVNHNRRSSWLGMPRLARASAVAACLVIFLGTPPASLGDVVWVGHWRDDPDEFTAQRFSAPGDPDMLRHVGFDPNGLYETIAVTENLLYSAPLGTNGNSINRWNAVTGAPFSPLTLDSDLSTHFLGGSLRRIGLTTTGDLLFRPSGQSTEQRGIPKYDTNGTHLVTYTHANVQHVQGSPAGNTDATFAVSRYNPGSDWQEDVLMWKETGAFIGMFDPGEWVGDVTIRGDQLYVLVYDVAVQVYDLNGTSLPTFSHTILLPAGVEPTDFSGDGIYAFRDHLFIEDDTNNAVQEIDLTGTLIASYNVKTRGTRNWLGQCAVMPTPGDINIDGVVGVSDLGILAATWGTDGTSALPYVADFTPFGAPNGVVSAAELAVVAANWTSPGGAAPSGATVVPVPSAASAGVVLIGAMGCVGRRRAV